MAPAWSSIARVEAGFERSESGRELIAGDVVAVLGRCAEGVREGVHLRVGQAGRAEFTPAQADAITNAVRQAAEHGDQVTSDQFKTGLAELRTEMAGQRAELTGPVAELTGQIAEQRAEVAEVRTEIANLDTRLSIQIAGVRTEIASLETRLIRWTVGTVSATGGLTFGILRFLG